MYLLILFLPFFSFFVSSLFGRYLGRSGTSFITTLCILITAILSTLVFYEVALAQSFCYIRLITWIDSALLHASWGLLFDSLTVIMLIVVSYVSTLVHFYSIGYMSLDPHLQRFLSYLSLFTFFMLILVTADNLIQMFIGWEGVGLASFLLINFWSTRIQANKSAMKALIVNRIGDLGLCIAIFLIFYVFGSVDYSTIFASLHLFLGSNFYCFAFLLPFDFLTIICFFLFLAAVGKSAQLGLHTWLPDAMEGPTPVSALIHAATMVTAGVFLIVRCSPLFEYSPTILFIITFIGAFTSFFAASSGAFQHDLKRVIAYSTCSQLGYMVFACGISSYSVTMFHLMNHAFFKALLFLSAGSIIHALHDEQDMRKMGALNRILPFTYTMTLIGSLALIGFPFLTGYYSKDFILELACSKFIVTGNIAYWLGVCTASFTTFYSYRLLFFTFINKNQSSRSSLLGAHEPSIYISLPLILLAFGSLFIGYLTKDMIIGLGTTYWGHSILILTNNITFIEAEYLPYHIKLIPLIFSHIGLYFAYNTTLFSNDIHHQKAITWHNLNSSTSSSIFSSYSRLFYNFFSRSWGFDDIYNRFIVQQFLSFGYFVSFRTFDAGWITFFGPYGITRTIKEISRKLSNLQSGYVYHYAFIILVSTLIFFFFFNTYLYTISPIDYIFLFVFFYFFNISS